MTQWTATDAGRSRSPRALLRSWITVLLRPRQFFRESVVPGDQGPALLFAMCVAAVAAGTRLALVPSARPVYGDQPVVSAVVALVAITLVVAPTVLHLVAALQTVVLLAVVRDRAGVSETVQVVAYASAPCALAGAPIPALIAACCTYGTALLIVGIAVRHDVSLPAAAALVALPAAALFGYGFGGFGAFDALLG